MNNNYQPVINWAGTLLHHATHPDPISMHCVIPARIAEHSAKYIQTLEARDQDAKSQVGEMRRARDEAEANYNRACVTIAEMHAAAVGEVTGPIRGVVEDVADLRIERDTLRAENVRLKEHAVGVIPVVVPDAFTDWLLREMPANTVIGDAKWWAPNIWRAMRNVVGNLTPTPNTNESRGVAAEGWSGARPKRIVKALASLAKAWPVLADHASGMDGEFDNALSDLKWYIGALEVFVTTDAFSAFADFAAPADSDAVIEIVPTALASFDEPGARALDHKALYAAGSRLMSFLPYNNRPTSVNDVRAAIAAILAYQETATIGVVVDDAMVERAFHHPHVLCHTGPEAKDYWRVLLTAALTTHTIVPLASAEPELWLARDINRTAVFASDSFNTPLYRGLIPTTEGASNGA